MKVLLFTVAEGSPEKLKEAYNNLGLTLFRFAKVPATRKFLVLGILRFEEEDFGEHQMRISGHDGKKNSIFPPAEFKVTIPGTLPENLFGGYDVQITDEVVGSFPDYGRFRIELRMDGRAQADWPLDIVPASSFPNPSGFPPQVRPKAL